MLHFASLYITKPGDNLGAPVYWDVKFQDIDLRANTLEIGVAVGWENAASTITNAGLAVILNEIDPLVTSTLAQIDALTPEAANLQTIAASAQNELDTTLSALVTTGNALVAELENNAIIDGGTF